MNEHNQLSPAVLWHSAISNHLARQVLGFHKKKDVPIIMLSVRSEVPTKVELLDKGADDYLTKPFSFEELMARIQALLRRPKTVVKDVLKLDNIVLDLKNQSVTKNKKEIYLTRKEFMLLELLVRNRGNVVSRGMIMEHVWSANTDPFSNTVETHIGSLRRKLKQNQKRMKQLIVTVPGRGYKVEV